MIPVVTLFCTLMMLAMMWMMMGGMSAFRSGPTDTPDARRDARERDGRSS